MDEGRGRDAAVTTLDAGLTQEAGDFGDQWNESSLVKFGNFFSFSLKEFEGEFLSLLQMIKKNKGTG